MVDLLTPAMRAELLMMQPGVPNHRPTTLRKRLDALGALCSAGLLRRRRRDYRLTSKGEAERERVRRNSDG